MNQFDNKIPDLKKLEKFGAAIHLAELAVAHREAIARVTQSSQGAEALHKIATLRAELSASSISPLAPILDGSCIRSATTPPLTPSLEAQARELALSLCPWRTGPFAIGKLFIDSEWQSGLKWDRFKDSLPTLSGKRVADVGCSNGYFAQRLALPQIEPESNTRPAPEIVVGFDHQARCYLQFQFLELFFSDLPLLFSPLSANHLRCFPSFFDLILCLGVIYHQRAPETFLKTLFDAMRSGGQLILESMVLAGEQKQLLKIDGTYAKARNVRWLPTLPLLIESVESAGFRSVETLSNVTLSASEQRTTAFAPGESWSDFLDPDDSSRTVEGYPAPLRATLIAYKGPGSTLFA